MKINRFILGFVIGCCLSSVLAAQDNPKLLRAADSAFVEKRAAEQAAAQDAIGSQADETAAQKFQAEQKGQDQVRHFQGPQVRQQAQAGQEYKPANGFQDRLAGVIRRASSPSIGRALVIRSSELAAKEQANLEEDLMVMSRVLEKTLGGALGPQPNGNPVLGIDVSFGPGSNPIRGLYLDGYGALFALNVSFPLVPSTKTDGEKEKPQAESAWDEARQDVYGQRMDGKHSYVRGEEYDQRKVNRLKDALLDALRNASNIRGLGSDDSVTVCVSGGPSAMDPDTIDQNRQELVDLRRKESELLTQYTDTYPAVLNVRNRIQALESQLARNQPRSTMLTVRAKKSDVDSFAKDKMSPEDFRKKAKVVSYLSATESPSGIGIFGGGGSGGGGYGTSSRF